MLREIHFAKKMDTRVVYSKTRFALLPAYDSREVVMAGHSRSNNRVASARNDDG
jgi:hypothetical protein